jgi:uncharacterized membrane protein HdeD (DUF308 family)
MLACMKTLNVITTAPTTDPVQREPELATQQPTEVDMSTTEATTKTFLIRGLVAIAWAAVFVAVSDSLTTGVSLAAGILVVIYPLIDVAGSLIDARSQRNSARRLLLAGAALSAVAAAALAVAATGSVADVLAVFGVWAIISGAAQVVVALRRRAQLGGQWLMLLAGVGSVGFGSAYVMASAGADPQLSMLAIYAAGGGIDFVVQAWLLARRRRRLAQAEPVLSAS